MDNTNKGVWIGGIVIVVLVLLGLWWLSSSNVDNVADNAQTGTTTTTGGTGSNNVGGNLIAAESRATMSVADIVGDIGGTSAFGTLFASTGVKSTIQGAGPYTIFVPTDGAFSLLPSGTIAKMTASEKLRLVQHHVISGRAIDPDAVQSGQVQSLAREMLNFEVSATDRTARVNSAFIIKAYTGKNGTVYLVSAVLLPPAKATQ